MNTLLLVIGFRPWAAGSSRAILTGIVAAITLFSLEMQLVTAISVRMPGGGTTVAGSTPLRWLIGVNAAIALAASLFWRRRVFAGGSSVSPFAAVPWPAWVTLLGVVLVLNVSRPLEAADPYHLEKVEWIAGSGTLAHNPAAETKINIVNPLYELLLADLGQVPFIGAWLMRLHGVFGLVLMLVAIAAVRELLGAPPGWAWAAVLAVPVLFHQLVLIKNDLFVASIGLVVLVWAVARAGAAPRAEIAWAAWLAGLVVAVKLTSLALLVIVAGAVLLDRRWEWRALAAVAIGGAAGLVGGGLALTLAENVRIYGVLMPIGEQGNLANGPAAALADLGRLAISLFDLGLLTREWWPGRGGWGGTFGLPFIWAVVVVASRLRTSAEARRALGYCAFCLVALGAVFPDADVAQRLALAPALMLVTVAALLAGSAAGVPRALRLAMVPVLVLSSAQIARSAFLYLIRGTV